MSNARLVSQQPPWPELMKSGRDIDILGLRVLAESVALGQEPRSKGMRNA